MDDHLRAGAAVFNAGHHHAAHDAWEDRWLALEADTADERFLHGLIQFTAAVHHAQSANWAGLQGLARSASGYLEDLDSGYRGLNLGEVRGYLRALAADPEHVERAAPPGLEVDGAAVRLEELAFPATAIAAGVLSEELDRYDEAVIERAQGFAEGAEGTDGDRFVALLGDFVADAERRGLIYERLAGHVERRIAELEDVAGLFEEGGR